MVDKIRATLVPVDIISKRELFGTEKELFGVSKGRLSAKDMIED